MIGNEATDEAVIPNYPVIEYPHLPGGGDAVGSGFVYNGKIAALRGKYLFTDITTGRIWTVDYKDMLAADDGNPDTMAKPREVKILWNGKVYDTMWRINEMVYHERREAPASSRSPTRVAATIAPARASGAGIGQQPAAAFCPRDRGRQGRRLGRSISIASATRRISSATCRWRRTSIRSATSISMAYADEHHLRIAHVFPKPRLHADFVAGHLEMPRSVYADHLHPARRRRSRLPVYAAS